MYRILTVECLLPLLHSFAAEKVSLCECIISVTLMLQLPRTVTDNDSLGTFECVRHTGGSVKDG